MEEDILKSKITKEVRDAILELLSREELSEVTDGRGVYVPFSRELRDALKRFFSGEVAGEPILGGRPITI
jgi:hypothetical protein